MRRNDTFLIPYQNIVMPLTKLEIFIVIKNLKDRLTVHISVVFVCSAYVCLHVVPCSKIYSPTFKLCSVLTASVDRKKIVNMGCNNNNNNRILEFSLQFCLVFTLPSLRANFKFCI